MEHHLTTLRGFGLVREGVDPETGEPTGHRRLIFTDGADTIYVGPFPTETAWEDFKLMIADPKAHAEKMAARSQIVAADAVIVHPPGYQG